MNAIQNAKDRLELLLHNASTNAVGKDQLSYAAGLADALELLDHIFDNYIQLGNSYYVLSISSNINEISIEKRILLRITQTTARNAFSFYLSKHDTKPIVLYGDGLCDNIGGRVFSAYDKACKGRDHLYTATCFFNR